MPLVPLDLKAGFYRNGTELDASNRWRDGSLVRWRDGSLRPIGGWQSLKKVFALIQFEAHTLGKAIMEQLILRQEATTN